MLQFGVFWMNKMLLFIGTICVSVPILWAGGVYTIVFDNVLIMFYIHR